MSEYLPLIEPGTLAEVLERTRAAALTAGALQPVATHEIQISDGGVTFVVRQVDSLARKAAEGSRGADAASRGRGSPFLPPETDLALGALSPTHFAVLNKFNVLDSHLLMVTRTVEHQETLLTLNDMEALSLCLGEIDGLAFYNGGAVAGASQSHKHLQLVPLPLAPSGPAIPMDPLLHTGAGDDGATTALPFPHAFEPLPTAWGAPELDPLSLHRLYLELLRRIGIRPVPGDGGLWQSGPYNLLVTRRWMLAVPRSAEVVEGVSVNALGFAGSLFVKDEAGLAAVRRRGPMRLLRVATGARGDA